MRFQTVIFKTIVMLPLFTLLDIPADAAAFGHTHGSVLLLCITAAALLALLGVFLYQRKKKQ